MSNFIPKKENISQEFHCTTLLKSASITHRTTPGTYSFRFLSELQGFVLTVQNYFDVEDRESSGVPSIVDIKLDKLFQEDSWKYSQTVNSY